MRKLKAAFWSKFESSRKSFLWARGRWRRIDGLLTRIESYSPSAKRAQARAKLSADFYDKISVTPCDGISWRRRRLRSLCPAVAVWVQSSAGSIGEWLDLSAGCSREWVLKRQDELRKRQDELDGEPGGFVGDPKNPQFGS